MNVVIALLPVLLMLALLQLMDSFKLVRITVGSDGHCRRSARSHPLPDRPGLAD